MRRRTTLHLLGLIAASSAGATTLAMRRTSTTFDEIVLIAGGVRGYATGRWDIAPEHPPLMQYVYGALPALTKPDLPPASALEYGRYFYSQTLFFEIGNEPEQLAFLGRVPAVLSAILLVVVVFAFTYRHFGPAAGMLAATICAFLPDVLAHGGVAYNDVPVAAAMFAAVWLADRAIRRPTPGRAAGFGVVAALALGTKNSALTLAPIVLVLLVLEAADRSKDVRWRRALPVAGAAAVGALYLTLVVIYRGDALLTEYRYAVEFVLSQVAAGGVHSYLLGQTSVDGWWYYFPVAFVFKTSLGFHVLIALTLAYGAMRVRSWDGVRRLLRSPLRGPLVTVAVFGSVLLSSDLNIGFRYAMPLLPMLAVITAVGTTAAWRQNWPRVRPVIVGATAWLVFHPLSYYPNFLTYISEYGPGRDRNYEVLVDSSMDWGQGLLQLRDFMRANEIQRVYLSYYGSGRPEAYGIDYVPLRSFLPLPSAPEEAARPEFVVISATNLAGGAYFAEEDPFHSFREREPAFVIGHLLYGFRLQPATASAQ